MNNKFIELIEDEVKNSKKNIFYTKYKNEKFWIKKARATTSSKIHKFFYKLLPFELLITSEPKTPRKALEFEFEKLQSLKSKNINVPKVIYKNRDFFVLEDTGQNIHAIFKNNDLSNEIFLNLVDKSLKSLANLHNLNLFHGGSQTRNFTLKNDEIFMIDFEESFSKNISLETLQFRDFLLYLLSFTKIKKPFVDFSYIIDNYVKLTNKTNTKIKLIKLIKFLTPLVKISKFKPVNKLLGSDVKNFITLINEIEKMKYPNKGLK